MLLCAVDILHLSSYAGVNGNTCEKAAVNCDGLKDGRSGNTLSFCVALSAGSELKIGDRWDKRTLFLGSFIILEQCPSLFHAFYNITTESSMYWCLNTARRSRVGDLQILPEYQYPDRLNHQLAHQLQSLRYYQRLIASSHGWTAFFILLYLLWTPKSTILKERHITVLLSTVVYWLIHSLTQFTSPTSAQLTLISSPLHQLAQVPGDA